MKRQQDTNRSGMAPGAKLVASFALFILLLGIGQIFYRYTLPTDGWAVYTEEIDESTWKMYENLVGADSELKVDDGILAVDDVWVEDTSTTQWTLAPENWQVGREVTMLVQRGAGQVAVDVPVVHWTPAAVFRYNFLTPDRLASVISAILLLAIGWFTFLRRPEVPSARALLLFCTALGVNTISGFLPDGLSVGFDQAAFWLTVFFSYAIFGVLLAPALFAFTLLFPRPKRIIQRHPWLALLPFVYGGLLALVLLAGGPAELGWLSTLAMMALSIISLVHAAFTQRDAASRAQLRWVISSFVFGIALGMLVFPMAFGLVTNPTLINIIIFVQSLGFVVIGFGLSIAVLRYHLYDIDVIIRKTLVYTVLTGLLALVYFGLVLLLQSLFESVSGEQSPVAIVISTLVIAALFAPLRQRVQGVIDRRFYRKKYDAQQVLASFAETARDETDMTVLTAELVRVVQETMQSERASLWLKDSRH